MTCVAKQIAHSVFAQQSGSSPGKNSTGRVTQTLTAVSSGSQSRPVPCAEHPAHHPFEFRACSCKPCLHRSVCHSQNLGGFTRAQAIQFTQLKCLAKGWGELCYESKDVSVQF